MKKNLLCFFDKIIAFFEKERFNLIEIFVLVFCISFLRMWFEVQFFSYKYGLINYAHTISFFFCVFAGGIFILKILTKERVMKLLNLVSLGFIILPLAPVIDYFIFGRRYGYDYLPKDLFFDMLITFKPPFTWAGVGQIFILYSIILLASIYVFIKTKMLSKSIIAFFIFLIFSLTVSVPSINPLIQTPTYQTSFFIYFLSLTIIFIMLIIKVTRKGMITSLLISIRPMKTLHFILMTILGIFVASKINMSNVFSYPITEELGIVIMSIITIVSIWWFTALLNDIYDIGIDKISNKKRLLVEGHCSVSQLKQIAIAIGIFSLMLSYVLGPVIVPSAMAIALAIIYSVPPFRLRRTLFSSIFIGAGSSLAFLIGIFTPAPPLSNMGIIPVLELYSISLKLIFIAMVIFIALSTGTVVKDLKDYRGDKKQFIKNIFTVYGMDKGLKISSFLLFISFLSPILIFNGIVDIIFLASMSIAVVLLFNKLKSVGIIFIIYFIVFIYCLTRWVGC